MVVLSSCLSSCSIAARETRPAVAAVRSVSITIACQTGLVTANASGTWRSRRPPLQLLANPIPTGIYHRGMAHNERAHNERAGNTRRRGPFWDGVEGRAPLPPAAATLGLEVVKADGDAGMVELAFTATEAFTNPFGEVLGAFLAAMLYDTVGPALLATLDPDQFQSTVQLNVNFLRPVTPGRFTGVGRVLHRSGDLALLEGSLATPDGVLVAPVTATAQVTAINSGSGANRQMPSR
jgi:uncharacterized protein (TIGR00369 family)